MSITQLNAVDGIGISHDGESLVMMIADEMNWQNLDAHLIMLENKMNAYLEYLESKQYKELYPDEIFSYAVFEIHCLYEPTEEAVEYLNVVQDQVGEYGILITCIVEEPDVDV